MIFFCFAVLPEGLTGVNENILIHPDFISSMTSFTLIAGAEVMGDVFRRILERGYRFVAVACMGCKMVYGSKYFAKLHTCVYFNPLNPRIDNKTAKPEMIYMGVHCILLLDLIDSDKVKYRDYADATGTVFAMHCPFCGQAICGKEYSKHVGSHATEFALKMGFETVKGVNVDQHPFKTLVDVYNYFTMVVNSYEMRRKTVTVSIEDVKFMTCINVNL